MQFRLLNFHKMMANFAVNLIGVFIPLIIYQTTGSLRFALFYLIANYISRFLSITLFKKQIQKYPQLFLLIRMVPMILYTASIPFLDVNFWATFVVVALFGGMSDGFAVVSNEVILNYSTINKSSKSFGITRFFEQLGIIVSVLLGGLILYNFSTSVLIAISISFYLISVFPLVIYYIKFRKEKGFNEEAVPYDHTKYNNQENYHNKTKLASKKILNNYTLMFFLMSFMDTILHTFNLYVFSTVGTFAFASFVSAAYNGSFGLSSYIVGKINEKHNTTIWVTVSCLAMAAIVCLIPFVKSPVVIVAMFALLGALYPLSSVFLIEKTLKNTRVLGVSNDVLFKREQFSNVSKVGIYSVGMLGSILPLFGVIAMMFGLLGVIVPKKEESTQKILVNYMHHNEEGNNLKTKNP